MANIVITGLAGGVIEIVYNDLKKGVRKESINLSSGMWVQRLEGEPAVKTNFIRQKQLNGNDVDNIAGISITGTASEKANQIYNNLKALL